MRSACMTTLLGLVALYSIAAKAPAQDPVLDIDFTKERSVVLGDKAYAINGDGIEVLPDGTKVMLFGRQNALTLPIGGMLEDRGTILMEFALRPFTPFEKSAWRPMVTLGTRTRMRVALSTFADTQTPIVQYAVSDTVNNLYHNSAQKLEFKRLYTAAITFDGEQVRCYLDGVLIHEAAQPAAIRGEDWRNLYIGPYNDGYSNVSPWQGDTAIRNLSLYSRVLSSEEIAGASGRAAVDIAERYSEVLLMPRLNEAQIHIDGELDEDVWRRAASFISLVDLRRPEHSWRLPEHHAYFLYDEENLYVGFDALFPGGVDLRRGHGPDEEGEAWGNESFELYFQLGKDLYRFAGTVGGGRTQNLNGNADHRSDWEYRSTTRVNIDDTVLWQGEITLPWRSIGLNAPPRDGVRFNFCRTWVLPETSVISALSLPDKGYAETEGFNLLKAAVDTPTIQILKQNDPMFGDLEQRVSLHNPGRGDVVYRVVQENSAGHIAPETLFSRTFGSTGPSPFAFDVAASLKSDQADRLVFELADAKGDEAYMRQVLPVRLQTEYLTPVLRFTQNEVHVKYRKNVVEAKYGANFKGRISLSAPDGRILASFPADSPQLVVPFKRDNAPGTYTLSLTDTAGGPPLSAATFHFPGFGTWEHLAEDNRILPPYTPLSVVDTAQGREVAPWGRSYGFAAGGFLPHSIRSQSEELLAQPASLRIGGKDVTSAQITWGKAEAHRVEFEFAAVSNNCRISGTGWLEYDGVVYYTVEVDALADVGEIELTFALPRGIGKYLHTASNPWGTKVTETVRTGTRALRYYPVVFLGNEEKGLCFFAESRHAWPEKSSQPLRIVANADRTTLKVRLASKLSKGQKFQAEFGLLATPVKKLPDRYPLNPMGPPQHAAILRPGQASVVDVTFTDWMPGMTHGESLGDLPAKNNPVIAHYQQNVERLHSLGVRAMSYQMSCMLTDEYPEVAAFYDEWRIFPAHTVTYQQDGRKHNIQLLCPTTPAAGLYLEKVDALLKQVNLDGWYFDFGVINVCDNHLHGCYERTPLLALRDYYRRIALSLMDAGAENYAIVIHNTDSVQIPSLTFATHLFNGEHVRQSSSSLLHNGKDILDTYPLSMFACELNSLPFGLTNSVYLPADVLAERYGGGKEEDELYVLRMTRAMMAGTLVHNTMPSTHRAHFGIFDKVTRIYDAFGVPESDFLGYYSPNSPAKVVDGRDVYVSCYRRPSDGALLAVISHLGNARLDQTVRIRFDPAVAGRAFSRATEMIDAPDTAYDELFTLRERNGIPTFRAPLNWRNGGAEVVSFNNQELTINLKAHTFALVVLE